MTDDEPARWTQRFELYKRALSSLNDIVQPEILSALNQLERDGVIKRYELAFELAWKTVSDFLRSEGVNDSFGGASSVIRFGYEFGVLENGDSWFAALRARNEGAHVYDLQRADKLIARIPTEFLPILIALRSRLEREL